MIIYIDKFYNMSVAKGFVFNSYCMLNRITYPERKLGKRNIRTMNAMKRIKQPKGQNRCNRKVVL